ncbi:PfkB family carbohydrate kinase [Mucilaginibacter segetis]|uniref:Sugar/nucleoside kinase (Ribokinase family) n=1 Tax=Mucilaginibacter segetis TaxID=2793071 RepID=A0A934ULR8_9SPHI|nr:PfkB family carbohydrate kinase [Mucilaginibacter segetis]MBK0378654.1 hypothetical protein [Mucilaginibacter segetis]
MPGKLKYIKETLRQAAPVLAKKKIVAGFDGFVDSIVKVVNHKTTDGTTVYFNTIKEFGDYISNKSGSGFSLESEELMQKLGGNMPIMANAMAQMGGNINCVGAFGVPSISAAFAQMHKNCKLYSFTNPGFTNAMEFTDGKLMLAQMTDLNHADWETIKNAIGIETLSEIFSSADLVCLVNWSELDYSNNIWQGLLTDVFTGHTVHPAKQFFFDLSDCSKRQSAAITTALKLIEDFGNYGKVTLSLNRNEANILYNNLFGDSRDNNIQEIGDKLFNRLKINTLIIHNSKLSLAWDEKGCYTDVPEFIAEPKISTGAGDNFNAGFCIGQLAGLNTELSLAMANLTSNCYIKTGNSPDISMINTHISG